MHVATCPLCEGRPWGVEGETRLLPRPEGLGPSGGGGQGGPTTRSQGGRGAGASRPSSHAARGGRGRGGSSGSPPTVKTEGKGQSGLKRTLPPEFLCCLEGCDLPVAEGTCWLDRTKPKNACSLEHYQAHLAATGFKKDPV